MTPHDLLKLCDDAIDGGGESIILVLPFQTTGFTPRLFKTFGPRGWLLCSATEGESTVRFDVYKVRNYLSRELAK